jgi:two-component system, NarL family, nitrate/nitrite response regulator NarL
VVVVGEIRFYRESLAAFLANTDGIAVKGTAASDSEAAPFLVDAMPVIVLLDVANPSDIEAVRRMRSVAPNAQVIALGLPEMEREVLACAEEGIVGFIGRDRSLDELVRAIESAAQGHLDCSPELSGALLRHVGRLAAEQRRNPGGASLTRREHEIAVLIAQGLSNKEIAQRLQIELPTVKNHVHHVLEKLKVSTRGQAAALVRTRPPGS